jgi:hypothetical protein
MQGGCTAYSSAGILYLGYAWITQAIRLLEIKKAHDHMTVRPHPMAHQLGDLINPS